MHPFSTTCFTVFWQKLQDRTTQFVHKPRSSQSVHTTVDKVIRDLGNLPSGKTNLNP